MKVRRNHIVPYILLLVLTGLVPFKAFSVGSGYQAAFFQPDTSLQYPIETEGPASQSPLYLRPPSNINSEIVFDPETNTYVINEKIGTWNYRTPRVMSLSEYKEYQYNQSLQEYWRMKSGGGISDQPSFIPAINLGGEAFDKVFGSNTINIVPTGSAELIFGFNYDITENPILTERLRKTPSFQFDEKILMNVSGSIGEKLQMDFKYNTEATFDFDQKTKLEYAGEEDEIIKKVEAGNVSLPLQGTLINGSMSLFGLKTEMQFGKLTVTSVFSQQRGESQVITASGGAQTSEYEVTVDDYDANRHFFLSDYFRANYNNALSNLPQIQSGVTITKIEVWVTNRTSNYDDARDIVALTALGEAETYTDVFDPAPGANINIPPRDDLNNAYDELTTTYSDIRTMKNVTNTLEGAGLNLGEDYEKIENARLLSSREYDLHPQLGYISLNSALNSDEILVVAYEYTYNGQTFKVGELSTSSGVSSPNTLIMKLLKPSNFTPRSYTWDLMMKNVYFTGAYQVEREDFIMDVMYRDDKTGNNINYIPDGEGDKVTLIKLLNLDNLDSQREQNPDGVFDFINGVTIVPSNGRIIFPLVEPFGKDLEAILRANFDADIADQIIDKYVFQELYDSTKTKAQQIAEKNKFMLAGTYSSSSSSEIMLNAMNVPEGSVKVIAGGKELVEGSDYTVDYTLGRVTIINQSIMESGVPVKISLENQSLFNFQTKSMVGSHFDYKVSENFNVGATVLHLTERPHTKKVNIGDEPISNTIWGLNTSYSRQAPIITTLVDKLPFIETKAPSRLTMNGEFAHLIPGHSKAIDKDGNAYIDDFEGSETSIDLKQYTRWHLASTPVGYFEEATRNNDLSYGYNRAKIAWYRIDPLLLGSRYDTPEHIRNNPNLQSNPYVYELFEQDIFPNKENRDGVPTKISVLNVAYYPSERGPYNYDYLNVEPNGELANPEDRWGGIMRQINSSDFESQNVEFIEFWLMDPYAGMEGHAGGQLYFNLGNISEDILKDSRKFFEHGMPTPGEEQKVDSTVWGYVPRVQSVSEAFDTDSLNRKYQDIGFDGLSTEQEKEFFEQSFLEQVRSAVTDPDALQQILDDPSSDNYHYFKGTDYDTQELGILDRYKNYNNPDGNSPTDEDNPESYPTLGSYTPDQEDINGDNTLSEGENYYSYRVDLSPSELEVGRNYIVDKVTHEVTYNNDEKGSVDWYQFRIPIQDYEAAIGGISDFKTIRFMRMFLTGFSDTVFLRFAKLELIRSEWRRYNYPFLEGGEGWTGEEPPEGVLDISAVNIEENAGKEPVNYVLPPGFTREIDPSQPQLRQLNEQSIVLKVHELGDGDARAAYKNTELDIRKYKKIEMEAHAEALIDQNLNDGDLTAFLRIGSDYQGNFYEYEVPLKLTPQGNYENQSESDREIVWPVENRFEIDLSLFTDLKLARDKAMSDPNSNVTVSSVYSEFDDKRNKVSVSGNPNLSSIRTIMIGVRNPKKGSDVNVDDGLPKSGEIWLNELRLSDFDERGGWAATGRATAQLADLGNVTVSGSTSTPGFGSIEQKVNERSQEQIIQYDVSSNLELGKFFNEESGVSIPLYVGHSKAIVNPEYDPYRPDITLKESLENAVDDAERDTILKYAQDYVERTSFALTNMRIMPKSGGKPRIYSISNWSTSFSINRMNSHNPNMLYYNTSKIRANLSYNYNNRPKNVQPFQKVQFLNNKWLRVVKDFNFYYLPSRLSFRNDMDRKYMEKKALNINNPNFAVEGTYKKDFYWNRDYDVKFDLTKNLKFDFSASNIARVDELDGRADFQSDEYMSEIYQNLRSFGRTTSYYHQFNLNYTLPVNKIPLLDWINLTARYNGTYGWDLVPQVDTLGNNIKNSHNIQLNGVLNFVNLYNKSDYLKSINDKYRRKSSRTGRQAPKQQEEERTKEKIFSQENLYFREGSGRFVNHNLKTEKITVTVFDENGSEVDVDYEILSDRRIRVTSPTTLRGASIQIVGTIVKGEDPLTFIVENSVRTLMSVRTLNLTYTKSGGTFLPGYMPRTKMMGMERYGDQLAPSWEYISGWYKDDFASTAFSNGWLTFDQGLNEAFNMNNSERLNIRASVEPLSGFKVELTGNMTMANNESEFFNIYTESGGERILLDQNDRGFTRSGNFSTTFFSWGSGFEPFAPNADSTSPAFDYLKFEARKIISERLKDEYLLNGGGALDDSAGYYDGFGPTSQDVLIPAFLSAYGFQDAEDVPLFGAPGNLKEALRFLMPNWKITYDGLGKIDILKEYVNSITLGHAYRSTYSIGTFLHNPYYLEDPDGLPIAYDLQGNFMVPQTINTVTISEQFSPMISLNMDWKNSLTTRFEIKKSRTVGLNMANTQVNEVRSSELVFGAGYRFNSVQVIINNKEINSDLNVRIDLSYRNNMTFIRKLEDISGSEITAGQELLSIKANADYMLSEKFTFRAFYDQRLTKPHVSKTFPTANYNVGFSLTFTL